MQYGQITFPDLPLEIELQPDMAIVRTTDRGEKTWSFRLRWFEHLTARVASETLGEANTEGSKPLLVHFAHASPDAIRLLRENRISFLGDGGECFLLSPPLIIDRKLPVTQGSTRRSKSPLPDETRNPFGRGASRVLRWLLLNPRDRFSMHELARNSMVSHSLVSRVTRALDEEGWIDLGPDPDDRRVRLVRMRRPRESLEAWGRAWDRRRIPRQSWNVRSDGADAVMRRLKRVKLQAPDLRWALGGLAGASLVKRVVEPGSTLLWVSRHDIGGLEEALLPTRSGSAHPQLRVATAPDDFIFDLAGKQKGLPVADQVQLWLDCSGEGERALEAADAIAEGMGW
jgi:hypothetical protein